MNIVTLENTLYTLIYGIVTPTVVSWDNQNAPRPDGGFISMRHNAMDLLGFSGYKSQPSGVNNTVYITTDTEFMLMIVGYNLAVEKIYTISNSLRLPPTRQTWCLAGVVLVDQEPIADLPGDVNSQIEPRRGVDLRLRVADRLSYSSNVIETVNVDLTLKLGSETVINKNISISQP